MVLFANNNLTSTMQYHKIPVPGFLERYSNRGSELVPMLLEDGRRMTGLIAEEMGYGPCAFSTIETDDSMEIPSWPKWLNQKTNADAKGVHFATITANFTYWNPRDGDSYDLGITIFPKEKQAITLSITANQSESYITASINGEGPDWIPAVERALACFKPTDLH